MDEDYMILPKSTKQNQQQIQLKLSTIFNQKGIDTPQTFGSFYDTNGEKYCAISVLLKYLGYDIAAALSDKIQNGKKCKSCRINSICYFRKDRELYCIW